MRLRPQNSLSWNYAHAYHRLETEFGERKPGTALPAGPGRGAARTRPAGGLAALYRRVVTGLGYRGQSVPNTGLAPSPTPGDALGLGPRMEEGFEATAEALRFLAARVEALESSAARRARPVEGPAWLIDPPHVGIWVEAVTRWLVDVAPVGEVVHGECGDGILLAALAAAGVPAYGVEPRGALAMGAARRGVTVHFAEVPDFLAAQAPRSAGGVVLSGVVERLAVEDLVQLLAVALDRIDRGGPVVVVGQGPDAEPSGWSEAAMDLLPGRPLHYETWKLLLERAGFEDVGPLRAQGGADEVWGRLGFAVKGRRPA